MADFEVGTTSVVGDVIILEATVRFHPTTIFFNGVPFIRKDAATGTVSELDGLEVDDSSRPSRPSGKRDSLKPRTLSPSRSGEMSVGDPEQLHDDADSSVSEKRTGSSLSSIPPPPPDDSQDHGDIALFCAVCGNRNDQLENTCPSCGSTLRISVLDPELGEKIAQSLGGTGLIVEKASPSNGPVKKAPPPPPPISNGRAILRANSPNREPPEVPTKRANTPKDQDPSPSKTPSLRPARTDLADQLQQAKLKAVEDAASMVRRLAEEKERAAEDAASAAASSDGDNDEKQSLRTRRGNATKKGTMPRSSSAVALTSFKILESHKAAALIASSGIFPKNKDEEKQEPTVFKVVSEFTDKDVGCFTLSIKNTSREDHVYYHLFIVTCYNSWVLKKRESDMMDLWNVLHENKVPDLPPRPRRTTGLGRRSGEELVKRMILLQEMLEGILKNKRALAIRATPLFLELYRALLPS